MDFEAFISGLKEIADRVKAENVSITWSIYPDYSEITVEPFQPVSQIVNHGNDIYYIFDEEENNADKQDS